MYFDNLYDAMKAIAPETLDTLSEDEILTLKHYLDFESVELCWDEDTVAVFDSVNGDGIGSLSVADFIEQTLEIL